MLCMDCIENDTCCEKCQDTFYQLRVGDTTKNGQIGKNDQNCPSSHSSTQLVDHFSTENSHPSGFPPKTFPIQQIVITDGYSRVDSIDTVSKSAEELMSESIVKNTVENNLQTHVYRNNNVKKKVKKRGQKSRLFFSKVTKMVSETEDNEDFDDNSSDSSDDDSFGSDSFDGNGGQRKDRYKDSSQGRNKIQNSAEISQNRCNEGGMVQDKINDKGKKQGTERSRSRRGNNGNGDINEDDIHNNHNHGENIHQNDQNNQNEFQTDNNPNNPNNLNNRRAKPPRQRVSFELREDTEFDGSDVDLKPNGKKNYRNKEKIGKIGKIGKNDHKTETNLNENSLDKKPPQTNHNASKSIPTKTTMRRTRASYALALSSDDDTKFLDNKVNPTTNASPDENINSRNNSNNCKKDEKLMNDTNNQIDYNNAQVLPETEQNDVPGLQSDHHNNTNPSTQLLPYPKLPTPDIQSTICEEFFNPETQTYVTRCHLCFFQSKPMKKTSLVNHLRHKIHHDSLERLTGYGIHISFEGIIDKLLNGKGLDFAILGNEFEGINKLE